MRRSFVMLTLCAFVAVLQAQDSKTPPPTDAKAAPGKAATATTATGPLDFTMKNIDGQDVPLSKYKGKVVLLVNVASKCGLTPQYEQLEELHKKYAEKGFVILAFPANNFGGQEPGTNDEIKSFCSGKYNVTFPLFSKISVAGNDSCELYKYLTSKEKNGDLGGPIKWNFTKFLIGRDGKIIQRFEPKTKPDAPEAVAAIEKALKEKTP